MILIETPKSPADMARTIRADFDIIIEAAPSNIQNLIRSRVRIAEALFEWFEQRIREFTVISVTNTAINQQLRDELSSIRKPSEPQQSGKRTRNDTETEKFEGEDEEPETGESGDEDPAPAKRRPRRYPVRRLAKQPKAKGKRSL